MRSYLEIGGLRAMVARPARAARQIGAELLLKGLVLDAGVAEGMAAGLPVVASRVGDLPDVVSEGRTGLLCAPDDPADLARALGELARAPQLRARLGAAARDQVLRQHTWGQLAARVLQLAGLHPLPHPAIAS